MESVQKKKENQKTMIRKKVYPDSALKIHLSRLSGYSGAAQKFVRYWHNVQKEFCLLIGKKMITDCRLCHGGDHDSASAKTETFVEKSRDCVRD